MLRATRPAYRSRRDSPPPQEPDFSPRRSFPMRVFLFFLKWGFVAAIWAAIFLSGIVAWYARELPEITRSPQFERKPSITVLANDGSVLARYGDIKGESLKIRDMPPYLPQAVLATEDRRFYSHFGLDPIGLARAVFVNLSRQGVVQGGSTITQQLAKNLFLTQERTFKRKVQEALLALWLETKLSKDEILEAYLNRVYMGSGAYGVDAAAQVYFRKSARDVSLREAAILAALLKAPSRYSPKSNPLLAEQRANVVLAAMKDAGYLDEKGVQISAKLPIPRRKPDTSDSAQYFGDWVVEQLDDLIGAQDKDLVIQTTMDPDIQKAAGENLVATLNTDGKDRRFSQGSVIVMRRDGAVLALVGGRDYDRSQFNRATHALRSPGSSFKPIVYLTAIDQGWDPSSLIEDAPITEGRYRPTNFDGSYYGQVPLSAALALSMNTAAVRLAQAVGIGNVVDTARRLGITSDLEPNLSLALGSSGVSALEMTTAYAVMASGGLAVLPYGILKVSDSDGKTLYERNMEIPLPRVFSPRTVHTLNQMMTGVVDYGTGQAAKMGTFVAGKTGTSQDYRDAWFIGFTNDYVASVWLGNDDNSGMKKVSGGSFPARIWRATVSAAMADSTPAPDHSPQADDSFSDMIGRLLTFQPSSDVPFPDGYDPGIPQALPAGAQGSPASGVLGTLPRGRYND